MVKNLLAGYISGTEVDLAEVRTRSGRVELFNHLRYPSSNYPDLNSILGLFFKKKETKFDIACFGVAGPVIKNAVSTTNLPWHIEANEIQDLFPVNQVTLINDIVATAHGLSHLNKDQFYTINEGEEVEDGNIGLIAAGAGLGEALVYRNSGKIFPYASEGGHADFAPSNQLETEFWQYLYSELDRVEVEDVLSLTGFERIYNFIVDTQGGKRSEWIDESSTTNKVVSIVEHALSGDDETASRTLDFFIDCYASEASNLALRGMTLGGIYIGGLIAPQIITAFDEGRFLERFIKPGKMESILKRIPVRVIIEEKTALFGAAGMTTVL